MSCAFMITRADLLRYRFDSHAICAETFDDTCLICALLRLMRTDVDTRSAMLICYSSRLFLTTSIFDVACPYYFN